MQMETMAMENPKFSPPMVEMELEVPEYSNQKQTKQPISIPFVWEEKPGTPKKDWKNPSNQTTVNPVVLPRPKLVPSVPFQWEEKPGKPFPGFSQPPPDKLITLASPDRVFESDIEACGYETPSSPDSETDSSRSSYETGTRSLVGAPFLECLFPLLSPDSGFLEKHGCSKKNISYAPRKVPSKDLDGESNCGLAVRRPHTLGELIMMSRRISYQRKAIQMRQKNLTMESIKNRAIGCCIFRINEFEELLRKWKWQLRLKL